jgi:predicted regulator of Ras-like GTPase activity (Roadblock/LC7/MglB family)
MSGITPPRNNRSTPPRDQAPSTFTRILERLIHATPGAQGAALVDFEGETVDYAGRLDPFELKVAAATWLVVLAEMAADAARLGHVAKLTVRARGRGFYIHRMTDNYALVVVLHARASFAVSERAVHEAIAALSTEAGWPVPRQATRWFCVEVESERHGRTVRPRRLKVAGCFQPVEIMGALVGLAPRERGFRVRLPTGAEMMLVRERLGRWFADEHVE